MGKTKSKALSFLLILSLFVGMVGIINTDAVYAASKKKIHVKKTSVSLDVGKTYQQKLIDKKGKTIKAKKVKWKSKNVRVAKINKKGKITAVNTGTAKMTAKYKGKTYKFTVRVQSNKSSNQTPPNNQIQSYLIDRPTGILLDFTDSIDVKLFEVSFSDPTIAKVAKEEVYNNNKLIRYKVVPLKNGITHMTVVNTYTGVQYIISLTVAVPMCTVYYPHSLPTTVTYSDKTIIIDDLMIQDTYYAWDYSGDYQRVRFSMNAYIKTYYGSEYIGSYKIPIRFYDEKGNLIKTDTYEDYVSETPNWGLSNHLLPYGTTGRVRMEIGD